MPRPFWSGQLRISLVSVGISLVPATETKSEIHFHQIDRRTGARVRNQLVSSADGEPLEKNDVVKGYEFEKNEFVQIEPAEMAKLRIASRSAIDVERFVDLEDISPSYYEKPYFVIPESPSAAEAFAVVRKALAETKRVALGKVALGGRERLIALVAPTEDQLRGMYGYTLRFAEELRDPAKYFAEIPAHTIVQEQLALAKELIRQKSGRFVPDQFHDGYEDALRALIEAKLKREPLARQEKRAPRGKVIDLMDALRQSVGRPSAQKTAGKAAQPRRDNAGKNKIHAMPAAARAARSRRKSA